VYLGSELFLSLSRSVQLLHSNRLAICKEALVHSAEPTLPKLIAKVVGRCRQFFVPKSCDSLRHLIQIQILKRRCRIAEADQHKDEA
jgi:hypothetical protein